MKEITPEKLVELFDADGGAYPYRGGPFMKTKLPPDYNNVLCDNQFDFVKIAKQINEYVREEE